MSLKDAAHSAPSWPLPSRPGVLDVACQVRRHSRLIRLPELVQQAPIFRALAEVRVVPELRHYIFVGHMVVLSGSV